MSQKLALELWFQEHGDKQYAYDFAGKKIKSDDYNVKNEVGWVVGLARPLDKGGTEDPNNYVIMHHLTAEEKANHYPRFTIEHSEYVVEYDERYDYYYIEKIPEDEDF